MDKAAQTMIDNLEKNTGKSLAEWIKIVQDTGLHKHGEILKYLKSDHNFTHGFANMVALKAKGTDAGSAENPEDLVVKQYKGKEQLQPIYEALVAQLKQLGTDVELAPKTAYVSVRSKKQFALIQPSTKTRLDVGINLKGREPEGRLEKSGSFNAMCTHRVKLQNAEEVDAELIGWLKAAYEEAR